MRSGLTARGTRMVQRMAAAQMLQECKIERVQNPTYSNTNLVAVPGSRIQVYPDANAVPAARGTCRIWEQENPSMVMLGESEFTAYSTVLSLPWNTTANVKVHDEVEITISPTDPTWVGARFRIQSVKQGGQIRATRSFVLERITPRP